MKIVRPLEKIKKDKGLSIFLGGATDTDWRDKLIDKLKDTNIILINPVNDDWDDTWEESITNKKFSEQVRWELESQKDCDINVIYFTKSSKAPISLLEMGLFKDKNMFVVCEEGYWKKGNVEIVCDVYKIPFFDTLDALVSIIKIKNNIK